MSRHEQFEELCALAALGEISADEFAELKTHLRMCAACQLKYSSYTDILDQHLPLLESEYASAKWDRQLAEQNGYEERFVARAERAGIYFSQQAKAGRSSGAGIKSRAPRIDFKPGYALILFALLATTGILAYNVGKRNGTHRTLSSAAAGRSGEDAAAAVAEPSQPVTIHSPNIESPSGKAMQESVDARQAQEAEVRRSLELELSKVREDYAALQAHTKSVEEQFRATSQEAENLKAESQNLKSKVESAKSAGSELESRLREAEGALAQMTDELKALRDRSAKEAATIATAEARIKELSARPPAAPESLDLEKLLAADRDIRELMGARKLHMIDVSDVDGNGRTRRAFGRIFYTESKSLIFYAFDLGDKKGSTAPRSFQAWGYREPAEQSARSLGLFYVDSKTQNRWVLKFDDPSVLAHINAVFVTIEPPGGSTKPSGHKLMYAYLDSPPNHP